MPNSEEGIELTRHREQHGFSDFDFPETSRIDHKWRRTNRAMILLIIWSLISIVLAMIALGIAIKSERGHTKEVGMDVFMRQEYATRSNILSPQKIGRIAFGSCTSHYLDPMPIWSEGVIPSEPDAWIWLGDFVYMDSPFLRCDSNDSSSQCGDCEYTYLSHPPHSCQTGDLDHALAKAKKQVEEAGYVEFLNYMCPEFQPKGVFPPYGTDPNFCPKPIMGTYDDHDSGWDNGNRRYPGKYELKNIFLDSIGEDPSSPRRNAMHGIEWKYTLNPSTLEDSIDVFLLDERYSRDPLSCEVRSDWCSKIQERNETEVEPFDRAWCNDFLNTGGLTGGSCCAAETPWIEWCSKADKSDAVYSLACDPTSPSYGSANVRLDRESGTLKVAEEANWENVDQESPFCEVLGISQRKWLERSLRESKAPLTVIGSGSVVFGNYKFIGSEGPCSGDDWECYHSAQLNLIHLLEREATGCVIILTGDYHYSDIKVLNPGNDEEYSERYQTEKLTKPIYQVMASGLTEETGRYFKLKNGCSKYREDLTGLRPGGKCSMVLEPAFGMLDIDWTARVARLQIRDRKDGRKIATGFDGKLMELAINIDTCERV